MQKRIGIVMAGGSGKRMYPLTVATNKHLLPVGHVPMIFWPLSFLASIGVTNVVIITNEIVIPNFKGLLGDGEFLGLRSIAYISQQSPRGIPDGLIQSQVYLDNMPSVMILGDNMFYDPLFQDKAKELSEACDEGYAGVFCIPMTGAELTQFGCAQVTIAPHTNKKQYVTDIAEKPTEEEVGKRKLSYAIPGLYFFPSDAPEMAKRLVVSQRGELEITDLLRLYVQDGNKCISRTVDTKPGSFQWKDMGTICDYLEVSSSIALQSNLGKLDVPGFRNLSQDNLINRAKKDSRCTWIS